MNSRYKNALKLIGLDIEQTVFTLGALPRYYTDLRRFRSQLKDDSEFPLGKLHPCMLDRADQAGATGGHYFLQDLYVAQRIHAAEPARHVDVGSRIDGFVAHVAAFRKIDVVDIRPLDQDIPNVTFLQADLMAELSSDLISTTSSLSCLHALEHFGLGRYGDTINAQGHSIGLANLSRMLKPSGLLYLSVPLGPQRIEFNAHRVFALHYLKGLFKDLSLHIEHFSFIDDAGRLHPGVSLDSVDVDRNCNCSHGCAIFELRKRGDPE